MLFMKDIVIFDFDGVIADTFALAIKAANNLAVEIGREPIPKADIPKLREMSASEILKYLGISKFKASKYITRLRLVMNEEMNKSLLINNMDNIFKKITEEGYLLGIVTTNSIENVSKVIDTSIFEFVEHVGALNGKDKALRKKKKLYNIIYVGDEARDIKAAQKAGVPIMAVSWGYTSGKRLKKESPDVLVNSPIEIVKEATRLFNLKEVLK